MSSLGRFRPLKLSYGSSWILTWGRSSVFWGASSVFLGGSADFGSSAFEFSSAAQTVMFNIVI